MVTGIGSILENKQLPKDNWENEGNKHLPIGLVDQLADELVREYSNPGYRKWYCKIIYTHGVEQVHEWRRRATEGNEPAKLFSKYVKDAQVFKGSRNSRNA